MKIYRTITKSRGIIGLSPYIYFYWIGKRFMFKMGEWFKLYTIGKFFGVRINKRSFTLYKPKKKETT